MHKRTKALPDVAGQLSWVVLGLAILAAGGCSGKRAPLSLRASLEARSPAVATLGGGAGVTGPLLVAHERRWGWSGADARGFAWRLPRGRGDLRVSCAGPAGLRVAMTVSGRTSRSDPLAAGWSDLSFPIERGLLSGSVTLRLEGCSNAPCGWGDIRYVPDGHRETSPPVNLLFIVVDTLRADAVDHPPGEGSTPNLDRLAAEGTLFTRAFAQASWTLPSMSSLLTGRWPSESPGWSDPTQGISAGSTPLAESLAASGFRTAAFVTNPLLKDDSGFGRGFETYRGSPPEAGVITPAAEPVSGAASWLRSHQDGRFFLFLHLMDPHDPYCPPARRAGPPETWPGRPDPAFTGETSLPDAATLARWKDLYREEVSYMDEHIGRLLDGLRPEVRARTLVVVTSDHGEEFLDHGFLKHAVTLFDEAVHVPLIVRMPGAPAGVRVSGIARLIDLVPTLAELLGVTPPRVVRARWGGVSLAGVVRGSTPMPPLLASGETFGFGPLRWYVYDGTHRVVLFNKDHRLPTEIPALRHPNAWMMEHLPREGVYVSTAEAPADREVSAGRDTLLRQAREEAARSLAGKIGGLWLSVRGNGGGGVIDLQMSLPWSDGLRFVPLFWPESDTALRTAGGLRLRIADDGVSRLAVVVGADEKTAAASRVTPRDAALPLRTGRPGAPGAGVHLWYEPEKERSGPKAKNEMLFRLRALGYLN